jgi:hypothetical protein
VLYWFVQICEEHLLQLIRPFISVEVQRQVWNEHGKGIYHHHLYSLDRLFSFVILSTIGRTFRISDSPTRGLFLCTCQRKQNKRTPISMPRALGGGGGRRNDSCVGPISGNVLYSVKSIVNECSKHGYCGPETCITLRIYNFITYAVFVTVFSQYCILKYWSLLENIAAPV